MGKITTQCYNTAMQKQDCFICNRIDQIKKGTNQYFVTELTTGYVVIGDYQFYHGYTLFLCKQHVTELHFLDEEFKQKFLQEMALVAQAVYEIFKPEKLNYELLGNKDSHLHWHLYPRYKDDPCPNKPIWHIDKNLRCNHQTLAKPKELKFMKHNLKKRINSLSRLKIV